MFEEVWDGIFKIEIPLPKNPLKYINSYIVKSKEISLIIDTGLRNELSSSVLANGLRQLEVDLNRSAFFITHMHADHCGLLGELSSDSSTLYFSKEDESFITGSLDWYRFWEQARLFAEQHGFPRQLSHQAILKHPGYLFSTKDRPKGRVVNVESGYKITVGKYTFECIKTPGHTRGHTCLYEKNNKILFSGDHVLYDITPNISSGYENKNPLGAYLKSLENIEKLDVEVVFPGHRNSFKDLQKRINQLKKHHKDRLDEVVGILEDSPKNAYEVAVLMSWDIDCDKFEDYPVAQKWFAHSEALAHLFWLYEQGKITKFKKDGVYIFEI